MKFATSVGSAMEVLSWGERGAPHSKSGRAAGVAVVIAAALGSAPALACPRCAAGEEARRAVVAEGFSRNVAAAVLPFLIVGAVSSMLHRVRSAGRSEKRAVCGSGRFP